jgi:hypothetical protein
MKVIILDFDNTLFPTSIFEKTCSCKFTYLCENINKHFNSIETFGKIFLDSISTMKNITRNINIITNCNKEWFNSCLKMMNIDIEKFYEDVKIYFSRDIIKEDELSVSMWKKETFDFLFSQKISNNEIKEIISIGDCKNDMIAGFNLKIKNQKLLLKNILFIPPRDYKEHFDKIEKLETFIKNVELFKEDLYCIY